MAQKRNAKQIIITLEPEIREALQDVLDARKLTFSGWVRIKAREEIKGLKSNRGGPYRVERGRNG